MHSGPSRYRPTLESLEERVLLDGSPDVASASDNTIKWSFGDTQNNLYVLKSYSPQDSNMGTIGALDPTLSLVIGARYTAVINSYPHHPLEILAMGSTPFEDVVLLAQTNKNEPGSQTSKWENDPAVHWVTEPASKSFSFTLTPALAEAMFNPGLGLTAGYRCGNPFHRGFQRGSFLLSSGIPAPKDAPHDSFGQNFDTASELVTDAGGSGTIGGAIDATGGIDVFQYVAPFTGYLNITQTAASGSNFDSLLLVYDGSRQLIQVGCDAAPGGTATVQIPIVAGATYHIQASGYQGSTGAYQLTLSSQPRAVSIPDARTLVLGATGSASLDGSIATPGGHDEYLFTASQPGEVTVTQSAAAGSAIDPILLVYTDSGSLVAADNAGQGGQISQAQFTVIRGQTYRVQAGALGLSLGAFSLSVVTKDVGDSPADAATISLSAQGTASISGTIDAPGEGDYYQFVAPLYVRFQPVCHTGTSVVRRAVRPLRH